MTSVLVACVGNIFKQDDGFGSAVAARLAAERLPEQVRVIDFGIRSVHLVYELMDGYDVLVLVDTVSQQDGPPGTLYVIEPELASAAYGTDGGDADPLPEVMLDAHDLSPGSVMALLPELGGQVGRILVVGVQPLTVTDGMGLSEPVQAAVEPAAAKVVEVVERELQRLSALSSPREVDS